MTDAEQHVDTLGRHARAGSAGAQLFVDLIEPGNRVAQEFLQQARVGLQDVHHHAHLILHLALALLELALQAHAARDVGGGDQQMRHLAGIEHAVEADVEEATFDGTVWLRRADLDAIERVETGHEFFLHIVTQQQLDIFLSSVERLGRNDGLEQFHEIAAGQLGDAQYLRQRLRCLHPYLELGVEQEQPYLRRAQDVLGFLLRALHGMISGTQLAQEVIQDERRN